VKRGDYIVLYSLGFLVLGLAALSFLSASSSGDSRIVLIGPSGRTYIDASGLNGSRFDVQGSGGVVTFELSDGALRCVGSNCDTAVCVDAGILSASNPIICAPNEVAAFVYAGGEYDAITR